MNKLVPSQPPAVAVTKSGHDSRGKFVKANSGRPRGSRNRRSLLIEKLFEGQGEEIAQRAVALALNGDPIMIRMIMDRLAPAPRGRVVLLPDFPSIGTLADVPPAMAHLAQAVVAGSITPDEAADVASIIEKFVNAIGAVDHEQRLAAIEKAIEDAKI